MFIIFLSSCSDFNTSLTKNDINDILKINNNEVEKINEKKFNEKEIFE
jgi:hypothetical protein